MKTVPIDQEELEFARDSAMEEIDALTNDVARVSHACGLIHAAFAALFERMPSDHFIAYADSLPSLARSILARAGKRLS